MSASATQGGHKNSLVNAWTRKNSLSDLDKILQDGDNRLRRLGVTGSNFVLPRRAYNTVALPCDTRRPASADRTARRQGQVVEVNVA